MESTEWRSCEVEESMSQQNFIAKDKKGLQWRSLSNHRQDSDSIGSGEFDCNICLDSVQEPVVTRCGHLYCWPCIYTWLNVPSRQPEEDDYRHHPSCPVCKAEVSQETLVPLFGRGEARSSISDRGMAVPRRPVAFGWHRPRSPTHPSVMRREPGTQRPGLSGFDPALGVVGELIHTGVFGTSTSNLLIFPTSYHVTAASPRARRQALQIDRSLGRVFFFLCCCAVFFFLVC